MKRLGFGLRDGAQWKDGEGLSVLPEMASENNCVSIYEKDGKFFRGDATNPIEVVRVPLTIFVWKDKSPESQ